MKQSQQGWLLAVGVAGLLGCSSAADNSRPVTVRHTAPKKSTPVQQVAPDKKTKPMLYSMRTIRIELERQPDGKKYPNYLKESYDLSSDSTLKYFGYFGGMPLRMNHTDSAQWSVRSHGQKVWATVETVVRDLALFADLDPIPDEGESPCSKGMYTIGLTKQEADVSFCVRNATRAFVMINKVFLELIAEFERRNGRPLTPAKLPQRRR